MNIKNNMNKISKRLVELRTFSDYTTKKMSELLEIDENLYVEYENGTKEIPINTIYKFANILSTEAGYILSGEMPSEKNADIVENGKGVLVQRYEGYSFMSLAQNFQNKTMNPMLVTIEPKDSPELVQHGGQEFNFVLEGELRVVVGNKEYYLRNGDSIYFDPSLPHAQLAMGDKPAKFLTVINE